MITDCIIHFNIINILTIIRKIYFEISFFIKKEMFILLFTLLLDVFYSNTDEMIDEYIQVYFS